MNRRRNREPWTVTTENLWLKRQSPWSLRSILPEIVGGLVFVTIVVGGYVLAVPAGRAFADFMGSLGQ